MPVPQASYRPVSKTKLPDQLRLTIRAPHYRIPTEQTHVSWIKSFILFSGKRHPVQIAEAEVNAFISHLAVDRNVSASIQIQAALRSEIGKLRSTTLPRNERAFKAILKI